MVESEGQVGIRWVPQQLQSAVRLGGGGGETTRRWKRDAAVDVYWTIKAVTDNKLFPVNWVFFFITKTAPRSYLGSRGEKIWRVEKLG